MPLTRIKCPECGAGLSSKTGFNAGQTVCCPKCETYFTVEEPEDEEAAPARVKPGAGKKPVRAAAAVDDEDEEEEERPRKKKKKKRRDDEDEEGFSYKNSWMRYVVLGVLLVIMVVLGILLILKKQREKEEAATEQKPATNPEGPQPKLVGPAGPNPGFVAVVPGGGGAGGVPPKKGGNNPPFPQPGGPPGGAPAFDLFGGPAPNSPEAKKLQEDLRRKLVGTWEGTAPDGSPRRVEYRADGGYTDGQQSGTWKVNSLVGSKGLKLDRTAGRTPVRLTFEGDELIHDGDKPGESVVLRKKA